MRLPSSVHAEDSTANMGRPKLADRPAEMANRRRRNAASRPELGLDLFAADQVAGVLEQQAEKLQRLLLQGHLDAVAAQLTGVKV